MAPTDNTWFAREMQGFYKAVEEDGGFEEKESHGDSLIDCENYAEHDGCIRYCSVCGKKLS